MKTREGYAFLDHRASPGLSEDFARACGYDPKHADYGYDDSLGIHCFPLIWSVLPAVTRRAISGAPASAQVRARQDA